LAAALTFFEQNPELSRDLAVLGGDVLTLEAQRGWIASFGELLRGAAAGLPGLSSGPRFRERFLIEGIRFQVGRRVLAGETASLQELRPELLRIVLAYYREAGPARKLSSGRGRS
jgi:hypothetical protein